MPKYAIRVMRCTPDDYMIMKTALLHTCEQYTIARERDNANFYYSINITDLANLKDMLGEMYNRVEFIDCEGGDPDLIFQEFKF